MAKITINPITSGNNLETAINQRLQQIEDSFNDDVLWRDGFTSAPNQMEVDLDMNNNDILNLLELTLGTVQVKSSIETNIADIEDLKTAVNALWPRGIPQPFPSLNLYWGQMKGSIDDQVDLAAALQALEDAIDGHDTDITALEGRVTTNEGDITALDGRVTTNEADITALEAADVVLQANIDAEETARIAADSALDARITSNDGDITSLDGRVTTNEGNITSLDGRVSTNETNIASNDVDIAALDGRVTTNESDIATAQADILTNAGDITTEEAARIAEDLTLSKTDGSRAFTGNVSGVTPTADAHLSRKDYVDEKAVNEAIAFAIALGG